VELGEILFQIHENLGFVTLVNSGVKRSEWFIKKERES